MADLREEEAFHCPGWNSPGIGIEIVQGRTHAEMYSEQLAVVVTLVDFLTRTFGVQRQLPGVYQGRPFSRLTGAQGGQPKFVGVIGHRDASANRGAGDPGDTIMAMLAEAGYERWNVDAREDMTAWAQRQQSFRVRPADGLPGRDTVSALKGQGFPHGLWVTRPGD